MKTITIKIQSEKDAELIKRLLSEANFEALVETQEESDYEISEEELQMLEERWEKYKANPDSAITLDALKEKIKKKYGI